MFDELQNVVQTMHIALPWTPWLELHRNCGDNFEEYWEEKKQFRKRETRLEGTFKESSKNTSLNFVQYLFFHARKPPKYLKPTLMPLWKNLQDDSTNEYSCHLDLQKKVMICPEIFHFFHVSFHNFFLVSHLRICAYKSSYKDQEHFSVCLTSSLGEQKYPD